MNLILLQCNKVSKIWIIIYIVRPNFHDDTNCTQRSVENLTKTQTTAKFVKLVNITIQHKLFCDINLQNK